MKFLILIRNYKKVLEIMSSQQNFQIGVVSPILQFASFIVIHLEKPSHENPLLLSNIVSLVSKYENTDTKIVVGASLDSSLKFGWISEKQVLEYPTLKKFPFTGGDIFLHIKSEQRDVCFDIAREVELLSKQYRNRPLFQVDGFIYHKNPETGLGKDLSGFEDGTENPSEMDKRIECTINEEGGSFCLAQKWIHESLQEFLQKDLKYQEAAIGRTKEDSEELDPKPSHSHVAKVTVEDENGEEIKVVRHSVVFGDHQGSGLFFISYANHLKIYDTQLRNMSGEEDGEEDGLFLFSSPVTGSYFYIPSQSQLKSLTQKSSI